MRILLIIMYQELKNTVNATPKHTMGIVVKIYFRITNDVYFQTRI